MSPEFQSGFFKAGVSNIVMSLWSVDDNATQQLMVNFYERILDGLPFYEALRESQIKMLKDDNYSHPFY